VASRWRYEERSWREEEIRRLLGREGEEFELGNLVETSEAILAKTMSFCDWGNTQKDWRSGVRWGMKKAWHLGSGILGVRRVWVDRHF